MVNYMKCPYAVNRQTITRYQAEYNAESLQTGYTEITNNNATFCECLKEEWGAFQDGRCHYYNS